LAQAKNAKAATILSDQWTVRCLSDQITDGLAERQPVAPSVRLRDLHRIVFKLQGGPGH
jgi:hypothetical protein